MMDWNHKNDGGHTLIELAVVMIIIGILVGPLFVLYDQYRMKQALTETTQNITIVMNEMSEYREQFKRYPCPARLDAVRGDADYGRAGDCTDLTVTPGNCANGICVRQSTRTLPAPFDTTPARVRVGAIPFRDLGLDEDEVMDGFGGRMSYAVTELLTDSDTFRAEYAAIDIVDGQATPESVLDVPGTAGFVVISHGPDKAGAYSKQGVLMENCPAATVLQSMNCGAPTDAVFRAVAYSESGGNEQFDDRVQYFERSDFMPWKISEDDPLDATITTTGGLGVNVDMNQDVTMMLRVDGELRARENSWATAYCDAGGTNCLPSDLIGGMIVDGGGMACPPGEFIVGIANGAVRCEAEVVQQCDPGEAMTGILPNGDIECETPPAACPAQNVNICGSSQTLNAAANGATQTLTGGVSYTQTFQCNNGVWQSISSGGLCTCNPTTATRTTGCGTGFTGTFTQTRNYVCPSGTWTGWTPPGPNTTTGAPGPATCNCVGASQNRSGCSAYGGYPSTYTGTFLQTRTLTCTGPNGGMWGAWTTVTNTCTCPALTDTRTLSCAAGFSGSITQERSLQCPAGTWGSWTTTANTCVCNPVTSTRTLSCPAGEQGAGINEERSFLCPGGTWTPWTETSRDCTPIPPVICYWVAPTGGGVTESTKRGPSVGNTCTCGDTGTCSISAGGGLYINYNGCTCQ